MDAFIRTGFFVLLILAAAAGVVAYLINQSRKKTKAELYEVKRELFNAKAAIEQRDRFIAQIQEARKNERERTEKITNGTDADRFAGSLSVLSELSRPKT